MEKMKILICDDHPLVSLGINLILKDNPDFEIVCEVENGKEALSFIQNNEIDIILLDVNMPVLNGLETCTLVRRDFPDIKVIMLTMIEDLHMVKKFIERGANAYVLKNSGNEEILDTIQRVSKGENVFDKDLIQDLLLGKKRPTNNPTDLFPTLSRREKEILELIIAEKTSAEIAKDLFISFNTVETHRRNMLNKLGLRNTAGLVRKAIEFDLLNK